jgi:adenylate cyclase
MLRKLTQSLLLGVGAAAVAWALWLFGLLGWIESPAWDWRAATFAGSGSATSKILIVLIDQNSLDWGRTEQGWAWPWPRIAYGAIGDFCARAGAKAVIFDMLYTEPSIWNKVYGDDDSPFGTSLAKAPHPVVGFQLSATNEGAAANWPASLPRPSLQISGLDTWRASHRTRRLVMKRASFPIPEIATNSAILGNVRGMSDTDKVIRRYDAFHFFDDMLIPSLGLAAALAAEPKATMDFAPWGVSINGRHLFLDHRGRAILHYRRRVEHSSYMNVSAAAVIQSEVRLQESNAVPPVLKPEAFKDCYVLVGSSAPGLMDLRATPLSPIQPGVEIHATFLDNLLSGDPLRDAPAAAVLAVTLLLGVLAALAGRSCQTGWHAVLAFVVLLPLPLVPGFAAYPAGYWMPVAPAEVAVALGLVSALILNYAVEGRQKRFIKGAFKQYISPHFIDRLVENPERLKLGGETRELSIYFSDVQGFTTISESLSPEDLTALLNEYLTAMTDIIMEEGGTVDKYEGDAVIAFWNAPLDLPDHAKCAVRAALRCQSKLTELRPILKEKYGKDLFCRIGLNTGKVVIGNMGSHQRFNYTFLGDAGNLAARLEGANKQFGTYMMISEFTRAQLGDEFAVRELSRLRVKGKNKPVGVFEPMRKEDYAARRDVLDCFAGAMKAYYDGRFKEALDGFSKIADQDAPARSYVRRCEELLKHPPAQWDGVWELTEK